MKRWIVWPMLALALVSFDAAAQSAGALMKRLEGSMLLTGRIDVAADGSIAAWSIDKEEQVRPEVMTYIAQHVPQWQVRPATVNGEPVAASTRFSMRLVARAQDRTHFLFNIASVHIEDDVEDAEKVRSGRIGAPQYPPSMLRKGATGIVHLLVRVDRDGNVIDTHPERVNLTMLAKDDEAERIRREFSKASMQAAKRWTYRVPTSGRHAGDEHFVVRVPVQFVLGDSAGEYGSWTVYLPGDRTSAPWSSRDDGGNDAAVPGRPMLAGSGMQLLSALEPGGS